MKQKIKEALKQGHKKLGVSDEVFERVAASVETFITDESQIAGFVASENTLNLLKSYQSMADKIRDLERINPQPNNEPNPQPSDNGNQPNPNPTPNLDPKPADDEKIPAWAQAILDSNKALSDELAGIKAEKAVNDTIATVNSRIDAWGYGKGYPKEMEKARRNAMELYEAYGKKWTPDELEAKIKEKFNMEVHDKGLDTSKPFESDGGGGGNTPDFKDEVEILKSEGIDMPE